MCCFNILFDPLLKLFIMKKNFSNDVLTLYDGDSNQAPTYKKFCGYLSNEDYFTSTSNEVFANFQTDEVSSCYGFGFKMIYHSLSKKSFLSIVLK